jgi:hypothetical protein
MCDRNINHEKNFFEKISHTKLTLIKKHEAFSKPNFYAEHLPFGER